MCRYHYIIHVYLHICNMCMLIIIYILMYLYLYTIHTHIYVYMCTNKIQKPTIDVWMPKISTEYQKTLTFFTQKNANRHYIRIHRTFGEQFPHKLWFPLWFETAHPLQCICRSRYEIIKQQIQNKKTTSTITVKQTSETLF